MSGRSLLCFAAITLAAQYNIANAADSSPASLKFISQRNITKPGFISIVNNPIRDAHNGSETKDLLISAFSRELDVLEFVPDIGSKWRDLPSIQGQQVKSRWFPPLQDLTWPNEVTAAPPSLFGQAGVLVAGGFLPPTKNNGGLWFAPYRNDGNALGELYMIHRQLGWFYHRALAVDVNNDGQMDILTCRARRPIFLPLPTEGRLVWFEPKDRRNPYGGWIERELAATHCDVFFDVVDIDGDGKREIITTDFFTQKSLNIFWTEDPKDDFTKKRSLRYKVIDNTLGNAFDVHVGDLNRDGKLDLVVTNHQAVGATPSAAVFAYEFPVNWKTQPWTRHTLVSDIPVRQPGNNQASPGAAKPFYPDASMKGKSKPYIMVSGDGAQRAYLLVPKSQDVGNWEYEFVEFHDCGANSVSGGIAVDDVDDDGYAEVFVPCYDADYVAIFSFAP
ncbi:hypothetical protein HK102_011863 [Quaeritorhiza haematococci]|nr:hypothetical protein HK102_011863 [Quaeritorhiza haematococci]